MAGLENRGKDKGSSGFGPAVLAVMKSVANLVDSFKKMNIWHSEMLVEMIQILIACRYRDLYLR